MIEKRKIEHRIVLVLAMSRPLVVEWVEGWLKMTSIELDFSWLIDDFIVVTEISSLLLRASIHRRFLTTFVQISPEIYKGERREINRRVRPTGAVRQNIEKSFAHRFDNVRYFILSTQLHHIRLDFVEIVARHQWKETRKNHVWRQMKWKENVQWLTDARSGNLNAR